MRGETRAVIEDAIAELPLAQRTVISLRAIEGWSSEEVCEALEISAGNQRILLHVRAAGSGRPAAARDPARVDQPRGHRASVLALRDGPHGPHAAAPVVAPATQGPCA